MDIGATVRCGGQAPAHDVRRHGGGVGRRAAARRARLVGSDGRGADRQQPAVQRAEVRSGTARSAWSCRGRRAPASASRSAIRVIGIAPADRERIFERHNHAPARRRAAASGLGLWLVRELALAHGGRVTVQAARAAARRSRSAADAAAGARRRPRRRGCFRACRRSAARCAASRTNLHPRGATPRLLAGPAGQVARRCWQR